MEIGGPIRTYTIEPIDGHLYVSPIVGWHVSAVRADGDGPRLTLGSHQIDTSATK